VKVLQQMLGHADASMTLNIYTSRQMPTLSWLTAQMVMGSGDCSAKRATQTLPWAYARGASPAAALRS
jgi:hypothetical protein